MQPADKVVTLRARAFTGSKLENVRCLVYANGEVRVWDSVAGHYTACHILTDRARKHAKKLAAK